MITAIDTNVLIDVFRDDPDYGSASGDALREAFQDGAVIACDAVWAEVAALFPSVQAFQKAMETLGVAYSPVEPASAELAGRLWRKHRSRGGKRRRMVADFLIGAHALRQADRLLTRDRGFFRTDFAKLTLLSPRSKR